MSAKSFSSELVMTQDTYEHIIETINL